MDFRTAIAEANDLLEQSSEQPSALSADRLAHFFSSEEGARGFFVALLTSSFPAADEPPAVLLQFLQQRSTSADSVLVRNLVMSSATEATHKRNGNDDSAAMSAKVRERTALLIIRSDSDRIWKLLSDMRATLIGESDAFTDFVTRNKYATDEKLAALAAVQGTLSKRPNPPPKTMDFTQPIE